jgi:nitrite reductase/ring-hydroxylating ferredoxin subunit
MAEFQKAAQANEIGVGEGRCVTINGKTIAIFNCAGEFFAIDDMCPHRGGSLGNGSLEGEWVFCPLHAWQFNVKTGQMPMGGGVVSYPTRVEGDDILVEI